MPAVRLVLIALGVLLLPAQLCAESRRIGYILPLTGDAAVFGEEARRGVELARSELSAQGLELMLIYEDDACTPKRAVSAWQKLTTIDSVDTVIGPGCTGSTLTVATVAAKMGRPVIALWDAGKAVRDAGDHVFSIGFDTEKEGELLAEYLIANRMKKAAVLWEEDQFAELVKDSFETRFKEGDGLITRSEGIHVGEQDLNSVIAKLVQSDPDALIISPAYSAVAALKAIEKLNVSKPVLGQDTFSLPDVLKSAGSAAEGIIFANVELAPRTQQVEQFEKLYKSTYGEAPTSLVFAAFGYDSLRLAAGLPKEVSQQQSALLSQSWQGVMGTSSFGEGRMRSLPPGLFTVRNGIVHALNWRKTR